MKTYRLREFNKKLIGEESIRAETKKQALFAFMALQGYSYWDGRWDGNSNQVELANGSLIVIISIK